MAASASFSSEDRLGIGAAVVAHVALATGLMWLAQQRDMDSQLAPPERIEVSLATDVSLESTAPDPSAQPAASLAPVITEVPQAPTETVPTPVEPQVQPTAAPVPRPTPTARRATPTPAPVPSARPSARATPAPSPSARSSARPTPAPSPSATQRSGGSRLSENFLDGRSNSDGNRGSPARTFGATEAASLNAAVQRQLRRHWAAPQGLDAELLVTVVRFRLNRDGSLNGQPSCIRQSGETASNAPQVSVHCDRALSAVRRAAPFDLPAEFYDQWRTITSQFDRRT